MGRLSEADFVEKGYFINPGLRACHHPSKHGAGNLQVGVSGLRRRVRISANSIAYQFAMSKEDKGCGKADVDERPRTESTKGKLIAQAIPNAVDELVRLGLDPGLRQVL